MSIKGFKLVSGEEIISRISINETGDWTGEEGYMLVNPRIIMIRPLSQTEMRLVLIPYLTSVKDGGCFVPASMVVTCFDPDADIVEGYVAQVTQETSGIQIAKTLNG